MIFRFIALDTETTGLDVDYSKDATQLDLSQMSFVVQLAYIIYEYDTILNQVKVLKQLDSLVKPSGDCTFTEIKPELTAIHGHTYEDCVANGRPIADLLFELDADIKQFDITCIIAHNAKYDVTMLDYECVRQHISQFIISQHIICTKAMVKPFMNNTIADNKISGARLTEAYKAFFGKDFENAHNAFADVQACAAVFIECCKRLNIWPIKDSVLAIQPYSNGYHEQIPNYHSPHSWKDCVQIDIVSGNLTGQVNFEKHLYIKHPEYDLQACKDYNVDINKCNTGLTLTKTMQLLSHYMQCARVLIVHNARFNVGILHSSFIKTEVQDAFKLKQFVIDTNLIGCYMHPELVESNNYIKREVVYKKLFNVEPTIAVSAALSIYRNFVGDYNAICKSSKFFDCLIDCKRL